MEPLDLFIDPLIESRHLKKGMVVRRGAGPIFKVVWISSLKNGGVLVQGKNTIHGGLVEIGCYPDTKFQVVT